MIGGAEDTEYASVEATLAVQHVQSELQLGFFIGTHRSSVDAVRG
jgi:hypothetical protein